jgi:N-acetyl sugar amidotransferase
MDETDPEISFNLLGQCNHCIKAIENYATLRQNLPNLSQQLDRNLSIVKVRNNGSKYDGIVGLSGGVDSSYLLHFLKTKGLNPLVVHIDAGWNSIEAVENIHILVNKLELDLETRIIDWESMRKLQVAYLRSGVKNQDAPQDHAFFASLFDTAIALGIRDIFSGSNLSSESIMPRSWGHAAMDGKNLKSIYRSEFSEKLKNFPSHTINWLNFNVESGLRIKVHKPLNYIDYDKDSAKKFLISEYGYREYGNKHSESTFTSYYQKVYLPNRFGIDKRKAHLSSLIASRFLTRDKAVETISMRPCSELEERNLRRYISSKLRVEESILQELENLPPRDFRDFNHSKVGIFLLKTIYKLRLVFHGRWK